MSGEGGLAFARAHGVQRDALTGAADQIGLFARAAGNQVPADSQRVNA